MDPSTTWKKPLFTLFCISSICGDDSPINVIDLPVCDELLSQTTYIHSHYPAHVESKYVGRLGEVRVSNPGSALL